MARVVRPRFVACGALLVAAMVRVSSGHILVSDGDSEVARLGVTRVVCTTGINVSHVMLLEPCRPAAKTLGDTLATFES